MRRLVESRPKPNKVKSETKPCDSAEFLDQLTVAKKQIVELQNQVFSLSSHMENKEKSEKKKEEKDNLEVAAITNVLREENMPSVDDLRKRFQHLMSLLVEVPDLPLLT